METMNNSVSLDEFRKNLSEIVARVMYGNQTVRVQKHNRSGVIVMSEREYENLKDPRKRYSKNEWQKMFKRLDNIRDRIPSKDQKKLEMDIDRAVREVRAEKKHNGQKN